MSKVRQTYQEKFHEVEDLVKHSFQEWGHAELHNAYEKLSNLAFTDPRHWMTMWNEARDKTEDIYQEAKKRIHEKRPDAKIAHVTRFPKVDDTMSVREKIPLAKLSVLSIQRLYSHVMRKNPTPKNPENTSENDTREPRSEHEQKFLLMADKLHRLEKNHEYKKRKRELIKKLKKEGKFVPEKSHEPGMPPRPPRQPRPNKRQPALAPSGGSQMQKAAIQPFVRSKPAMSSRLPAFPTFPAYRRR